MTAAYFTATNRALSCRSVLPGNVCARVSVDSKAVLESGALLPRSAFQNRFEEDIMRLVTGTSMPSSSGARACAGGPAHGGGEHAAVGRHRRARVRPSQLSAHEHRANNGLHYASFDLPLHTNISFLLLFPLSHSLSPLIHPTPYLPPLLPLSPLSLLPHSIPSLSPLPSLSLALPFLPLSLPSSPEPPFLYLYPALCLTNYLFIFFSLSQGIGTH